MLHNTFRLSLLFVLIISGCSKDDLPEFNKLEGLRIVALQASSPEVDPGASVTITPVVSDLTTSGLTYTVQTCLDPGISVGAEPTCENNATKQVVVSETATTNPGSSENWTGVADTFSVTAPSSGVIFANKSAQDKYNGVNFIIEYILKNSSGSTVKGIKRLVVSDTSKTTKNTNPTLTQVYGDGVALSTLTLNTKINLTSNLAQSSAESYSVQLSDGTLSTRTENLAVTWFITDGKTKYYRSEVNGTNEYTTPTAAASGRSMYLIAVAKDDRGGVSFVKKKF